MPVMRVETLVGFGFEVTRGEQRQAGSDGRPLFNGDGSAKTVEVTEIHFVDLQSGLHKVVVPLDDAARAELVRKLTGGVVPAGPGDLRALEVVR